MDLLNFAGGSFRTKLFDAHPSDERAFDFQKKSCFLCPKQIPKCVLTHFEIFHL